MSTAAEVDRLRKEVQSSQQKAAGESAKVANAREKEHRAREQVARASTPTSRASRLREADRHAKAAVDAEKRRAGFERKIADKQKALHTAEGKLSKAQTDAQKKALKQIETRTRVAEKQFRSVLGLASSAPPMARVESSYDVFISHASEDKAEVAGPLADLLIERGVKVWYDEFALTVGDSLRRNIDRGLASSRFGVIILSPDFFGKDWPQAELDGLVAKQRASGDKVILPVWHRVTKDDVLAASPTLADLKALNTALMTMVEITDEIAAVAAS